MFEGKNALALTIKNRILANFIYADIEITFDEEQDEYFISTRNKELYYSESYGMLILEISQEILWKQGIFNFYFVLDVRPNDSETLPDRIKYKLDTTVPYTTWNVCNNLLNDGQTIFDNYYLAA